MSHYPGVAAGGDVEWKYLLRNLVLHGSSAKMIHCQEIHRNTSLPEKATTRLSCSAEASWRVFTLLKCVEANWIDGGHGSRGIKAPTLDDGKKLV